MKKTRRLAKLERRIAKLERALPTAAEQAVANVLDVRSTTHVVGFATVYPSERDA